MVSAIEVSFSVTKYTGVPAIRPLKEDYGEFYGFEAEHAASRIMFC